MKETALFQSKTCRLCEGRGYVCFFTMIFPILHSVRHRVVLKNICGNEMESFSLFMLHKEKIFLEEANDLAQSSRTSIIEKSYLFIKKSKHVKPTLPCVN